MSKKKLVLNDVCKFVGGSQPPKDVFINEEREGYIRLIQTRDYKTDSFKTYIPIELARRFCAKDDIMIGRYGPPVFQILRGLEGAYNVALMKAIPKSNIRNEYLYYFLSQNSIFKYVDGLSKRTGGQTGVDLDSLRQYPIDLPEFPEQDKKIKVLGDLDAKIELINKINTELEAMAKTIYEYWFVQFDFPNEKGKPYKSSGGKMLYNEQLKREIPEGWQVKKLSEIANLNAGGDKPKKWSKQLTKKYKIPIYSNGITEEGLYGFTDFPKIENPSITVSARGTIGYSVLRMKPYVPIVRLISITPVNSFSLKYLHEKIKSLKYDDSGSVQKQLTVPMMTDLKMEIPPENLLKRFSEITLPFAKKIEINKEENLNLASLRDWLLPMLMNGQVSVGEAEEELRMVAEENVNYNL